MFEVDKFEFVTIQQLSAIKIDSNNNIEIKNGITKLQTLEIQISKIQQKKHYEEEAILKFFNQNKYPFISISRFISTFSMQFFTLQLLINTQLFTLIRDIAAEFDNKTITFIPLNLPRLENCMPPLLAQYLNDDVIISKNSKKTLTIYRDLAIIASRNIDFRIDFENIIFEKVKHIRKQKHQIYYIMMLFLIQSIKSFHINFNVFKQAVQYYKNPRIDNLQNLFLFFFFVNYRKEKIAQINASFLFLCSVKKHFHINNFLKEPDSYKKFHKHLHKNRFLQIMETKKDNFVSMNT